MNLMFAYVSKSLVFMCIKKKKKKLEKALLNTITEAQISEGCCQEGYDVVKCVFILFHRQKKI